MALYLSALRKEYQRDRLRKANADPDPIRQFTRWFDEALASPIHEPNGMTLATVGADGRPAARVVLLKEYDATGFCFFSNYASRKGMDLAANPYAALVFWWGPLERQVRIEGRVEKLPEAESDAYYASRPVGSRLGAWVSMQSSVIPTRELLEKRLAELEVSHVDKMPERPAFWGGYRVAPDLFEFWQGGPHRLHDRLRYTRRNDGAWAIDRLSP